MQSLPKGHVLRNASRRADPVDALIPNRPA
jgi:hypothetical protein